MVRRKRPRSQILCLFNSSGRMTMEWFDDLEPIVQERLRNSPYNICCACVHDAFGIAARLSQIEEMEQMIRDQEESGNG